MYRRQLSGKLPSTGDPVTSYALRERHEFLMFIIRMAYNIHTPQYFSGDKIQKNEIGGACSTYGGEERRIQGFGGET